MNCIPRKLFPIICVGLMAFACADDGTGDQEGDLGSPNKTAAASTLKYEAPGNLIDSNGLPIVNQIPGLPDWSEADISGLIDAVDRTLNDLEVYKAALGGVKDVRIEEEQYSRILQMDSQQLGTAVDELERTLGNYLGQSLVRGVDLGDLVNFENRSVVGDTVSEATVQYFETYEDLKLHRLGEDYEPTVYDKAVLETLVLLGGEPADLELEGPAIPIATPSGSYTTSTLSVGLTFLSGYTTLWTTDGTDNDYADVPLGFNFEFYPGDGYGYQTAVRVSTNGYLTFYQEGGNMLDGTDWGNDSITNPFNDPDGFVAAWWDDMSVETSQGSPDRISHNTTGSVGNRVFTVEYYSMSRDAGDIDDYHYFQMKLYEEDNAVEILYDVSYNFLVDSLDSATSGLEDYTATDGDCGLSCSSSNSTTPSSSYRFVPVVDNAEECDGRYLDLSALTPGSGASQSFTSDSSSAQDDYSYTDIACWPSSQTIHDEQVFQFTLPVDTYIEIDTTGSSFRTKLAVVSPCPSATGFCFFDATNPLAEMPCTELTAGTYSLIQAGWSGATGAYNLNFTECEPVCGNNIVETGETCDDGNTADCDGCRGDCSAVETGCGDTFVCGTEVCDDGNTTDCDGCRGDCSAVETGCGDTFLCGTEVCDDGNTTDCDGCRGDCSAVETGCGDNFVCGTEACDDGNTTDCDGCRGDCSAVETGCGDTFLCGTEVCDDGNTTDCDGCRADCSAVETGCGDTFVCGTEACDDGNTTDCDGCRGDCSAEETGCGDGFICGTEECDDLNTTIGDGCDDVCAEEDGWECTGEPSTCEETATDTDADSDTDSDSDSDSDSDADADSDSDSDSDTDSDTDGGTVGGGGGGCGCDSVGNHAPEGMLQAILSLI